MRWLGTYFSKELANKSMLKFDYFIFFFILNFLFSWNLFADFFKFFKCRLFNIIPENLKKIFVYNEKPWNNEKIETNNGTRLLIFDDKNNFYFLNMTFVV